MLQGIAGVLFTALALIIPAFQGTGSLNTARDVEEDKKELQGKWVGTGPDGSETAWEVKDDIVTVEIAGMRFVSKAKINPDAKPHAEVDFTIVEPEDYKGKIALGIYKLDKDKGELALCISMPDNTERPKKFENVEGESMLYNLKKAK